MYISDKDNRIPDHRIPDSGRPDNQIPDDGRPDNRISDPGRPDSRTGKSPSNDRALLALDEFMALRSKLNNTFEQRLADGNLIGRLVARLPEDEAARAISQVTEWIGQQILKHSDQDPVLVQEEVKKGITNSQPYGGAPMPERSTEYVPVG